MEGTGNNYIYLDYMSKKLEDIDYSNLSKKISDYNFGIGSDGLILICKSELADAKMLIYNKDGSEALMCGNGIRCVGKYLYDNYYEKEELLIETKSGIKKLKKINDLIEVNMGKYDYIKKDIIKIDNINYELNYINIGNPHIVIYLDDLDIFDIFLSKLKEYISIDDYNIELVKIINRNEISLRVHERGSKETMSCGTGATASVIIGIINNYLDNKEIKVNLKGGILYIRYDNDLYMRGPAKIICKGKYYN